MNKYLFVGIAAILAATSIANAYVVGATAEDDNDGVIEVVSSDWVLNNEWTDLNITAIHNYTEADGVLGHLGGNIESSDELLDPIVWIKQSIQNDTLFDWTDYHITLKMSKQYSIDATSGPLTTPPWTAVVTDPVQVGSQWIGAVDYNYSGAGTEILIGDWGDFGIKVSFLGSAEYCTEQWPTPEPVSAGLLALGGLVFLRRRG